MCAETLPIVTRGTEKNGYAAHAAGKGLSDSCEAWDIHQGTYNSLKACKGSMLKKPQETLDLVMAALADPELVDSNQKQRCLAEFSKATIRKLAGCIERYMTCRFSRQRGA